MAPAPLPSQQTQPTYRRTPRAYHHGRSPAAWVGSMGTLAGSVVAFLVLAGGSPRWLTVVLRRLGYGEGIGYRGERLA